nr:CatB-related O-acetyltransferase [Agathobaculum massiliense]
MFRPNPDAVHPNENIPSFCYIKNVITRPNIEVGAYTYYDDADTGGEDFEAHVTRHYEFLGDKLIIGKFCAIGKGVEFVMKGANHRMASVTTYPFNIFAHGWEKCTPALDELPLKGDTVVGNDVWIGQHVTALPSVHIGDGAIIGANAVVANEKCFDHLFITPHKSCIFSLMLDITGFFTLFVQPELPSTLRISSQIFAAFLMFFPEILVKALVKEAALPTGNFKRLPHAAVHLWRHQTSHGYRYSALR